jgi:hypothetical protein
MALLAEADVVLLAAGDLERQLLAAAQHQQRLAGRALAEDALDDEAALQLVALLRQVGIDHLPPFRGG